MFLCNTFLLVFIFILLFNVLYDNIKGMLDFDSFYHNQLLVKWFWFKRCKKTKKKNENAWNGKHQSELFYCYQFYIDLYTFCRAFQMWTTYLNKLIKTFHLFQTYFPIKAIVSSHGIKIPQKYSIWFFYDLLDQKS